MDTTRTTAADILRLAIRIGQVELIAEHLEDRPESADTLRRIRLAEERGYLRDDDGIYQLTDLGHELLGTRPEPPAPTPSGVPAGHYAVPGAGRQPIEFYVVEVPDVGKWAGYTFVSAVVGGHPDARIRGREGKAVLARIAEYGVARAAQLYGQEIGRCAVCNRHLTDDESRAAGMGPDCRSGATPRGAAWLAAVGDAEFAH